MPVAGVGAGQGAQRHHPGHETQVGVRFAGPDKLVHLIEAGEVVQRLGRGFADRLHRPAQIGEDITDRNQFTALTLRVVFSLPLRQTEGFLDSLLRLMGLNLKAPDHTTLSRRNPIVAVPPLTRSYDGPIDLIVDSTGLKILGCGEWNAHKHQASKKRRDWRKLHIGVDAEGFIVAAALTASSRDDASTLPALLDTIEVPIRRFTADGAYDHRSVYDQLSAAGTENVVIVIPPRRSAVSAGPTDGPWAQRDTALERIRQVGRREWQKESGYRQQARVENSFFRYKSVLGGGLKARHGKAQRREVAIGCHILNRMAELGRPKSCAVVS